MLVAQAAPVPKPAPQDAARSAAPAPLPVPQFEVASIRLCNGSDPAGRSGGKGGGRSGGDGQGPSPDRLNMNCQPVQSLIRAAYVTYATGHFNPMERTPIEGGPSWINSDRYQITAKAEGTPGQDMMRGPMLRALLEDRFKVKMRRETREVPAYALTVGKGGPKLKPFQEGSCVALDFSRPPEPGPDGKLPQLCVIRGYMRRLSNGPDQWQVLGASLDEFSRELGGDMDRMVVNKTGISGRFDFHLEFTPDETTPLVSTMRRQSEERGGAPAAASDPAGGPSIFTAIQQQLGLKLEPAKGAREFLVIDRVERPSEN